MHKYLIASLSLFLSTALHAAPEKSWWDSFKESVGMSQQDNAESDAEENKSEKASKEKANKGRTSLNEEETARLQAWLTEQNADKLRKGKGLPKGLQKKLERGGELPPGWQRKVGKGDKLTDEEYESATRIPDNIRAEIKIPDDVLEVIQIGDRVGTVVRDGREIIDIITGK